MRSEEEIRKAMSAYLDKLEAGGETDKAIYFPRDNKTGVMLKTIIQTLEWVLNYPE